MARKKETARKIKRSVPTKAKSTGAAATKAAAPRHTKKRVAPARTKRKTAAPVKRKPAAPVKRKPAAPVRRKPAPAPAPRRRKPAPAPRRRPVDPVKVARRVKAINAASKAAGFHDAREALFQLLQLNVEAAAKAAGVHVSTVRRWRRRAFDPANAAGSAPGVKTIKKVVRGAKRVRDRLNLLTEPGVKLPPGVAPKAQFIYRIDPRDPTRRKRMRSDTIFYNTQGMGADGLARFFEWLKAGKKTKKKGEKQVAIRVRYMAKPDTNTSDPPTGEPAPRSSSWIVLTGTSEKFINKYFADIFKISDSGTPADILGVFVNPDMKIKQH